MTPTTTASTPTPGLPPANAVSASALRNPLELPPLPADPNTVFIRIENLSLQFLLYHNKGLQLKEFVIDLFRSKLQRATAAALQPADQNSFNALTDLSLHLAAGTRLGIIGRNGAGKTTLLRTIARIYQPTSGRILLNGSVAALIEIGSGFDPELSARENILLGGSLLGRPLSEMRARSAAIIDFAGIGAFADVPIKYYSTGMNLRLAFALATDVEPDILLLDEMFAGGDQDFQMRAKARMTELIEKTKIMVMVSHLPELVRMFCTHVLWLEQGRIKQYGSVEEVLAAYAATP